MSKEFAAKPKRFAGGAGGFGPKKSFGDRPSFGARAGATGGYGAPRPAFGAARPSFGGPRKSFGGPRPAYGAGGGYGSNEDRPSFEAVCDVCKKDCRVPFRPNGSKPVLCTNCFRKDRGAESTYSGDRAFAGRDEGTAGAFGRAKAYAPRPAYGKPAYQSTPRAAGNDGMETRMKALEAKVDRILKLLGGDEGEADKA